MRPQNILLATILLIVFAAPAAAQPEDFALPDTRAGQIAAEFFKAFNADPEAMREFTLKWRDAESLERTPIDQRVERYKQMLPMFGTLTPYEVRASSELGLGLVVHAAAMDAWLVLTFDLQDAAPFKLSSFSMQPTGPPAGENYFEDTWTDLADLLEQTRESTGIPGMAVAVIENGEIAETAVVGMRQNDGEDAVELADRFHVGSVTKSMTGTVIASLVEDGTLTWDLTVGEVLGGVKMNDVYRDVTVRQLLQHRGGLQPYTHIEPELEKELAALPGMPGQQRAVFLTRVLQEDPVADPGTSSNYTNAGYALLGHIAERNAGKSWEQLMRDRVFTAMGMPSAHFGWPATKKNPGQPRGHFVQPTGMRVQMFGEYELGPYIAPAGDVSASVEDVARYAIEHLRGMRGQDGVLKSETIQALHDPGTSDGDAYAGGWVIDEAPDGAERHWHNGSAGTFFAVMQIVPERNWGFVVLMNSGSMTNQGIGDAMAAALYGRAN